MPPKCTDASLPTLGQLSAELRDFKNWYLLGLQLDISKDTLDFIEKTHDTRVRQCIEMVQYWIKNSKSPTWEAVHKALRNIGESVLAEEIACKYDIQPKITRHPVQSQEHSHISSEESSLALKSSNTTRVLKPRQFIIEEQMKVSSYFATLVDMITEFLEKKVTPEKLLRFLRFHCHPLNPEMLYLDQHILQCTSSVSEVMESLVPDYINYMNTGLLEAIIERFECSEAQSLLQQYHDRYPNNRLLRDMPEPVPDERLDLTKRKRLRAKCDEDFHSARASDVKRIQTTIQDATGIHHWFVTPAQHSEGSLILTFLISESVCGIFQELINEDLEILADAGIVQLRSDNFVINDTTKYCHQKTENSTRSTSCGEIGVKANGVDSYMNQRAEQLTSMDKHLLESIPKSRLEEICSDSFLLQLATHMKDWRELAPHFGITQHEEEELAHHYHGEGERSYQTLNCWKHIHPKTANYKNLIACLVAHAPYELVEAALKMLTPGSYT